MKRILKGSVCLLVSAGVAFFAIVGICTYLFPEPEEKQDEDDDFDDFVDPELESGAWKID